MIRCGLRSLQSSYQFFRKVPLWDDSNRKNGVEGEPGAIISYCPVAGAGRSTFRAPFRKPQPFWSPPAGHVPGKCPISPCAAVSFAGGEPHYLLTALDEEFGESALLLKLPLTGCFPAIQGACWSKTPGTDPGRGDACTAGGVASGPSANRPPSYTSSDSAPDPFLPGQRR